MNSFQTPKNPWPLVWLQGPDTADFLQRMTSAQVSALQVGAGTPATFLTPQGKLIAHFWIWRMESERFLLEARSPADPAAILAALETFHFAEDFTSEPIATDWKCAWIFGDPTDGTPPSATLSANQVTLPQPTTDLGEAWTILWGIPSAVEKAIQSRTKKPKSQFLRQRIQSLTPSAPEEISSDVNPLEVGLAHSIADQKGCYPGQEVLEKIISLGSPARRLVRFKCDHAIEAKTPLLDPKTSAEIGAITSVTFDAPFIGLAIVRKTVAHPGQTLTTTSGLSVTVEEVAPFTPRSNSLSSS